MPLFVTDRDYAFMTGINEELINQIIETYVIMYSLDKAQNQTNLYGENTQKLYNPGIKFPALITHDDQTTEDGEFGPNVFQNIIVGLFRPDLKVADFYPERGDVFRWNDAYFEVTQVIDNQLVAGRYGLPHSILCTAVMVNRASINIREEVNSQDDAQTSVVGMVPPQVPTVSQPTSGDIDLNN
jgi:hypothetical protein